MKKSNSYFILGTDTDVGKTLICAGLLKNLPYAQAIKVIQTGSTLQDQQTYIAAGNSPSRVKTLEHLQLAASPHLAAADTNIQLSVTALSWQIKKETAQNQLTFIEGSGGILTPINHDETFLDLIADLSAPAILVIKNVLGAINHSLLTINQLRYRGIDIAGIIFTHPTLSDSSEDALIAEDNIKIISQMTALPVLATVPYIPELTSSVQHQFSWEKVAYALKNAAHVLQSASNHQNETLTQFDREHLWHPYSQMHHTPANWLVEKTHGCTLYLDNGLQLIDGMSSWWSAIHGYNHPVLLAAINQQASQMPHIMFGGLTHKPAILLGQRLVEILPDGLERIFYADSGSVAVEVAIKMAIQYFHAQGLPHKNKLVSFMGGYHGDTFGAMSVCDPINGMHTLFNHTIQHQIFAPKPTAPFDQVFDPDSLNEITHIITEHHHECAAIIIEPIVQGAGGMWFYHPDFLKALRTLCSENNILLIVDEIATGFGRTGKLFASNWAGISPDIMCIGKALTGGTMTLAATITTEKIAQGISAHGQVLMHGPTFMANPLACHVALTSIDLLLRSSWQKQVSDIEQQLKSALIPLTYESDVADVRVLGAIGVVEMVAKVNVHKLQSYFVEQCHVWIRPFNNLIYIMPPFIIQPEALAQLTNAIRYAVQKKLWA